MAKANVDLPNGTKIHIDGTSEEIGKILELYKSEGKGDEKIDKPKKKTKYKTKKTGRKKSKSGPKQYIRELKTAGFFKVKRNLKEVQKKLEEKGHIYPMNELSTPLRNLVQDSELGRIKGKDGWVYVNRQG
ncbi:MAG: hypothetical protein Q8N09_09900 [Thermodesulfovibrionia bacterium]|nr:hypothetical protein [Thermodesulfovibrionia bacterium]